MFPSTICLFSAITLLASSVTAAPTVKRQADLGIVELLEGICDNLGGVMITKTVCETVTGSDISVAAANEDGL